MYRYQVMTSMRLNHRSSLLIGREPVPVMISDNKQRQTAHARSSSTNKAKAVAKRVVVKAKRWR